MICLTVLDVVSLVIGQPLASCPSFSPLHDLRPELGSQGEGVDAILAPKGALVPVLVKKVMVHGGQYPPK